MKKTMLIVLAFALSISLAFTMAFALTSQDGTKLSGPHYQFNIIGHPKNVKCIGGDDSNGRAIMVPLRNVGGPSQLVCASAPAGNYPDPQNVFIDDIAPTYVTLEPVGAKIYFQCGNSFDIIDRDACDSDGAKIQVECTTAQDPLYPDDTTKTQNVIAYEVYIRVLGKPNTCMNIQGYAYDDTQGLWFNSGTVYLNRSTGKSTFVKATDLFDVWWCDVDPDSGLCIEGTQFELSVFNDVFDSYFWNIINDGTRLVQVRLYPVTQQ